MDNHAGHFLEKPTLTHTISELVNLHLLVEPTFKERWITVTKRGKKEKKKIRLSGIKRKESDPIFLAVL